MKTKIKAKDLSGIREVENTLARREAGEVLNDLPPGHPLKVAVEAERQSGGDITDLPESHPLKVALREARERLLASQSEDAKNKENVEKLKVKKAKKLQETNEHRDKIDEEEQRKEEQRNTYRVINEKIDHSLNSVDDLLTVIGSMSQDQFGEDRFSMVKLVRLQRLMFAARRGLGDSKLKVSGV